MIYELDDGQVRPSEQLSGQFAAFQPAGAANLR
jgi:hypothetical protein